MALEHTSTDRVKELKRQYYREWYAKNRDRVRASQDRYWAKKAAEAEQREREEAEKHETNQP